MANQGVENWTFHNSVTTTGSGKELNVTNITNVNFEISGTATSSTCIFEGKSVDDGSFYPIQCVNLTTLSLANQTTSKGELWQIDCTGLVSFRVRISVISGGNLTIKGRGVR